MSATDAIWTALIILMTVCVCVDSGITVFSGIQAFELAEDMLYITFPSWGVWATIFGINLPLEVIGIFSTRRYPMARGVMYIHAGVKLWMLTAQVKNGPVFWSAHYLNQAFILILLYESIRSFFTERSPYAQREPTEAGRRRPASKTTTASSHQLAFVRGLT